jgi:hypothetical protein
MAYGRIDVRLGVVVILVSSVVDVFDEAIWDPYFTELQSLHY